MATLMGIDFGSSTYKVVLPPGGKRKQLSLALNEQSSRKTETTIGFRADERLFGGFAKDLAKFSPQNTYPYLRDLLGVRTVEDAVQRNGKYIAYAHKLVVGNEEYPYIAIQHGENNTFAVHELIAMIFQQARKIAEKEDGGRIVDACITVPNFFTQDERQQVIEAAQIAGLNVLSLINQGTAWGVSYGTEQTFEGDNYVRNAIFFDLGESSLQLTLGQYTPSTEKGKNVTQFQVLASTWEMIGGRDFTHAMIKHLINTKLRSKIEDVDSKPRVYSKLHTALTKVKETLSVNNHVDFSVPNLDGGFDFDGSFSKQTFEEINAESFSLIIPAVERLLAQGGIKKEDISVIEMVGGSSRVPKVQALLKEFFGRSQLDRHLNADESAAFGAAFFGASVSGRYKMKGIKIKDITFRNATAVIVGTPASTTDDAKPEENPTEELDNSTETVDESESVLNKTLKAFGRGSRLGANKKLSFPTTEEFTLSLEYIDDPENPLPIGIPTHIDTITFTKIPRNKTQKLDIDIKGYDQRQMDALLGLYNLTAKPKAIVKLKLGNSGLIEVSGVAEIHYMEQVETKVKVIEEVPIEQNETKEEETEEEGETEGGAEPETEGGEEPADEPETEEDNETKTEAKPTVKKVERWDTKIEWVKKRKEVVLTQTSKRGALPTHLKIKSKDILAVQDQIEESRVKTLKIKNDLESLIYESKQKLSQSNFIQVTNESQREELSTLLSETGEWLEYESEGATYLILNEKTQNLTTLLTPINHRLFEKTNLPIAVEKIRETLADMRDSIQNLSSILQVHEDNITDLTKKINSTLEWVTEKLAENELVPAHEAPSLTTTMLKRKVDNLTIKAKKLFQSPKKKPEKPKPTTPPPSEGESKSEEPGAPPPPEAEKAEEPGSNPEGDKTDL